jgi:diguanylate cyclase (GGDEF)-like protein
VQYVLTVESESELTEFDQQLLESGVARLAQWYKKLDDLETDHTTGLFNRNRFNRIYNAALRTAQKKEQRLGIILADANDLKNVNDAFGHPGGDVYLRAITQGIKKALYRRHADIAFRYGGDEFVILLPDTDSTGVAAVISRLYNVITTEVRRVEETTMDVFFPEVPISIAGGEYQNYLTTTGAKPAEFFKSIDADLYIEKERIKSPRTLITPSS